MQRAFNAQLTRFFVLFVVGMFLVIPALAFAQDGALPAPGTVGVERAAALPGEAGLALAAPDPRVIVAQIVRVALGFLGLVAVSLIIYGGYLWMTSAGNEEKIEKARRVMVNAAIGLAIILSALAITQFILNRLLSATGVLPLPPPFPAAARVGGGALGSGLIESHFPMRGATNVARNTRIVITFKEPISPASIANTTALDDQGNPKYYDELDFDNHGVRDARRFVSGLTLRTEAIQIIRTDDIRGQVGEEHNADKYLQNVAVSFTEDLRTYVLKPADLLGSAAENIPYTVYICGTAANRGACQSGGIKLLNGQDAFRGFFRDYQWSFETGTFLDLTPPQIAQVIPLPDNAQDSAECADPPCVPDQPRNVMVQITFNEPVLPTVSGGKTLIALSEGVTGPLTRGAEIQPGSYDLMRVLAGGSFLAGEWRLGNQYRTAEFVSADLCGSNSCNEDVFCLPKDSAITGQVLAASIADGGPASQGNFDGIEDMAGNSLDGNSNSRTEGPQSFYSLNVPQNLAVGDNAQFSFWTSGDILLIGPAVEATRPATTFSTETPGAPMRDPVEMDFNHAMALTTLDSNNLNLSGRDKVTGGLWDTWWTVEGESTPPNSAHPYGAGLGRLLHGGFWEESEYISSVSSRARDLYQNCYYPAVGEVGGGTCTRDGLQAPNVYCCNGEACAAGDVKCQLCGF